MASTPLKIGELASQTGLSIRALHHYDEIGLLRPSARTPAGHRLYDRADVVRLQRIQSLRLMGLSLDEVKRLLDGAATAPRQLIDMQLARIRDEIELHTRLAERLTELGRHLDLAEGASLDDLCRILMEMTKMESYFTPEQLAVLKERRESVGDERAQQVRATWNDIIPRVRNAMEGGVDPTSPEILALARAWKGLVHEFTAGDPAIANAVRTMYEKEGPALQQQLGEVPTPEMFVYMGKAFAAMRDA